MKKLPEKSGLSLEKVSAEQRKIGWGRTLWSKVRRGAWLGDLHQEYDQFAKEISQQVDEFRQRIAQISHRLAYLSGATDREKYEFYTPAQPEPQGSLAERIASLVNKQSEDLLNGQASVSVPALVTNGHGVFPQVSEEDEIDFRKVEVDREPVALFQRVIDQLWHQLYDRFQLVEEFLGQVINGREDYLRKSRDSDRGYYKIGKTNELAKALEFMTHDILALERYLNTMESYLKAAYFISKVDECLEAQGEPADFDLIMDPYHELKKHFQSLVGLLRIGKYDELRVQEEMRLIDQIQKQMTELELRRFERSERVNEQVSEAGKVIARLENTFKMLSALGARAGEEFSSQVGAEIKEILAQLDSMVARLKENPALIDKGVIQKWFAEQLDKIREIEKRCEEIGLSGILPSSKKPLLKPAMSSREFPLLQSADEFGSVADVLFKSVIESLGEQENDVSILESIMGLHSHQAVEWRLKLARSQKDLWPDIAASFAGINLELLTPQQQQEIRYVRSDVWRSGDVLSRGKVLIGLIGDDSDEAWDFRTQAQFERGEVSALLKSIYGSDDSRAWKIRAKSFSKVTCIRVLDTLCGLDSEAANHLRNNTRLVNFSCSHVVMQSFCGVDSELADKCRRQYFERGNFDFKIMGISLAGVSSEYAYQMRQELFQRGEFEALVYALAGDFSREAEELRSVLQDKLGFEAVLKSYTGGGNLTVLATLKRLGILDKYFGDSGQAQG